MAVSTDIILAVAVLGGSLLIFILVFLLVGYTNSLKPACPAGYRAISVDGSKSLKPNSILDIINPSLDYPTCSPMMTCPTFGQQWAIHADGSALTNRCPDDNPGCPCSAFQHCPVYSSTLFRQFGRDERISLFQVIDPLAKDASPPEDPYDVPYILKPGLRDSCYLTATTIDSVWPAIKLGDQCLRGRLAKLSTSPSLFVCAPSQYVVAKDQTYVFDVDAYMKAYLG